MLVGGNAKPFANNRIRNEHPDEGRTRYDGAVASEASAWNCSAFDSASRTGKAWWDAAARSARATTGYQDFVDEAPLDLVYVANYGRMTMVPVRQRESYASVAAGAISQNVYLFAASAGLSTVIRAWIDREAIANTLGLTHDQQALLSQTIGYPRS